VSGGRIFGTIALVYVEVFRGTSLVVQLFRLYYALPLVGISFDPVTTGIVGLALNTGACDLTMLLVTHEMRFAREVADRIVVMDAGRIIEDAPPSQLFSDPQHERTKTFLSTIA
jgi:ABC-type arginine transport system ATPase subunit